MPASFAARSSMELLTSDVVIVAIGAATAVRRAAPQTMRATLDMVNSIISASPSPRKSHRCPRR